MYIFIYINFFSFSTFSCVFINLYRISYKHFSSFFFFVGLIVCTNAVLISL